MPRLLLSCVLLASFSSTATAGTPCWTIKDDTERATCRAAQSRSAGDCSFIEDRDAREQCRARATGNTNRCSTLSTEWERRKCRDAAKAAGN